MPTSKIGLGSISGGPAEESMPVPNRAGNWAGRWNSDLGGTLVRVVSQRATRGPRIDFVNFWIKKVILYILEEKLCKSAQNLKNGIAVKFECSLASLAI